MVWPTSKSVKNHHPWIEKAKFEDMPQHDVLRMVLDRVKSETRKRIQFGGKAIKVIFDLDSTVFDVKPRTLRILKEFIVSQEAGKFPAEFRDWVLALRSHQLSYTLKDTAIENKFPHSHDLSEEFWRAAFQFWKERFFSDPYLLVDQPVPGAQDYVKAVIDAGAIAVYLTGRDWPGMGRGTQSLLSHWGFPTDPKNTILIMKPNFGMDDADFKDSALLDLRAHGSAVAFFDNEPANFHVFEKNFPGAHLVFYHSNCSAKEAKPVQKIYKIDNFLFD